jgi:lysophospholipase L1-like esterase
MSDQAGRIERRFGPAAAYVGGALTAFGALGVGLLFGQVLIARLTIPGAEEPPPRCDGDYGLDAGDGPPLRLAVIGDSTAAGYGVRSRPETPGALLATWIAEETHRPVRLTCPAVVGSVSAWLDAQVEIALGTGVDLAIIFIGANDVTTVVNDATAARYLYDAVRTLREAGAEVVVATCPDLGTVRPIQPPLRWLARRWSRQLAAAQTVAAVRAGARTVSLGDLVGPQFAAAPDRMFGADRFHPSDEGYRAAAAAVLPAALAALGLEQPAARTAQATISLADAAATAVETPGTEISAAEGVRHSEPPPSPLDRLRRWANNLIGATHPGQFAVPSLTGARSPATPE